MSPRLWDHTASTLSWRRTPRRQSGWSLGGSRLGPYVAGAGHVVLAVGSQKTVRDVEEGLRRIREHVFPLEDERALAAYGMHSAINKLLIINGEIPGRITVILVDEPLGF